jgi:hypothetical protein
MSEIMLAVLLVLVFFSGLVVGMAHKVFQNNRLKQGLDKAKKDLYDEQALRLHTQFALSASDRELSRLKEKISTIASKKVGQAPKQVVTPKPAPPPNPPAAKVVQIPRQSKRQVVSDDLGDTLLVGATAVAAGMAIASILDDSPSSSNDSFSSGGGGDFSGGGASGDY